MKVAVLVNPRSAGGTTERRLAALRQVATDVFGPDHVVIPTERAGHATELAASLDCERVIAVGGDGTAHEVANGLMERAVHERPVFGLVRAGTGCDLVRTLGMPTDLRAAFQVCRDGEVRAVDCLRVAVGSEARHSINVAGFGLSGAVVEAVNHGSKALGGRLSFALATATATWSWSAPEVRITWRGPDGPGSWTGPLASCFVANGRYCGGGMLVGPAGSMHDGLADLTIIPEQPPLTALRYARRLYDGRLPQVPGVVHTRVTEVDGSTSSPAAVLLDLDGEQPGRLPATFTVVPGAIPMAGLWR
jgi:YegS/Rv2252/BmrU family lipid kinase